jgi:hypothetical protein
MNIIPKGHFVLAHRYHLEQNIIEVPNQDDEGKWMTVKIDRVGSLVVDLVKGDIAMAKCSDINYIPFNGEEHLYIDEEFVVKVEI